MCHNNLLSATLIYGNGKSDSANFEITPATSVFEALALERVKFNRDLPACVVFVAVTTAPAQVRA
jgi:hypothetical protein